MLTHLLTPTSLSFYHKSELSVKNPCKCSEKQVTIHGPLDRDSNGFCHYKSPSLRKDRKSVPGQAAKRPRNMRSFDAECAGRFCAAHQRREPLRWAKPISSHGYWPVIAQPSPICCANYALSHEPVCAGSVSSAE